MRSPLALALLSIVLSTTCSAADWKQMGQDFVGKENGEFYGHSVALSGNGLVLAVSAPFARRKKKKETLFDVGYVEVYVWNKPQNKWKKRGPTLWGSGFNPHFGLFVALSRNGKVLAVNNQVYVWSKGAWKKRGKTLKPGFIESMSADGSTVALRVSFPSKLKTYIRVMRWSGGKWIQIGSDIESTEYLPVVDLSKDARTLVVGEPDPFKEKVRVFSRTGDNWSQKGPTVFSPADSFESFGNAVATNMVGSVFAVGAHFGKVGGEYSVGRVLVYKLSGSKWKQRGKALHGGRSSDEFGRTVSMSADTSTVVVRSELTAAGRHFGQVQVFKWNGQNYVQKGKNIDGEMPFDRFGSSLAVSYDGSIVAAGAPYSDGVGRNVGLLRVYSFK